MEPSIPRTPVSEKKDRRKLRTGFSTGTAMTAAARAALRRLLTGETPHAVAVRLPVGYFIPIPILSCFKDGGTAWASVIKDGGDDPDVTHKAEIRARVTVVPLNAGTGCERGVEGSCFALACGPTASICLIGGEGVGVVTKPGLPVGIGEPAINPVPREMLARNLSDELRRSGFAGLSIESASEVWVEPASPHVCFPLEGGGLPSRLLLEVEVAVEKGIELARFTLNPRLGIVGGISILGTTGIVRPFSHEAYEETIQAALSVALSNGCREVILSTGGKSERFAQDVLTGYPPEAFVQIADFFAFAVGEASSMGFKKVVHSAFFGKVVKMAQGHDYTHAHKVPLDLAPVAELAAELGYDEELCGNLVAANTARHALMLLLARKATDLIQAVARGAVKESIRMGKGEMAVRLLLFDYDGTLLADLEE